MSAIRRKYSLCARTCVLIIAHLAVLGLPFYYGYYRFFGYSTYRALHIAKSIKTSHSDHPSRIGWDKNSRRALLLDKRFAHEHVWCCLPPFFFLPLRADDQEQVICCSRIQARTGWLRLFLRGPPNDRTIG